MNIPTLIKSFSMLFWALFLFASCNPSNTYTMHDTIPPSWIASVTSAKGYPIEVHVGYMSAGDKFITPLPKGGEEKNGWHVDGQEMMSGGTTMPTEFSLTWVSFAEKKFWKVDGKLPAETMRTLFEKGVDNYDRVTGGIIHETYKRIVVAVAPGGTVAIFLTDHWHRVKVGQYQAKEVFVDVNEFYDNPHQDSQQQFYDWWYENAVSDSLKAVIEKEGLPIELWRTEYPKKYNWRFKMEFYKEDKFISYTCDYFNGESNIIRDVEIQAFQLVPLPFQANLKFTQKWAEIKFDDQEIMTAFEELAKDNKVEPIEIVGKVGFMYKEMTFLVKSKKKAIPLKKTEVKFWNRAQPQ